MEHYNYNTYEYNLPPPKAARQIRPAKHDRDTWLNSLPPPLDSTFTFTSIPLVDEPQLVHNGLPAEGFNLNIDTKLNLDKPPRHTSRPLSLISSASATSSGTCLSSIPTEGSDSHTVTAISRENSPQKHFGATTTITNGNRDDRKECAKVVTYACSWGGCRSIFKTHAALSWHVKAEHLLICPVENCNEGPFGSGRVVEGHVDVVHLKTEKGVREWRIGVVAGGGGEETGGRSKGRGSDEEVEKKGRAVVEASNAVETRKRKCREDLEKAMERKFKKRKGTGTVTPFFQEDLADETDNAPADNATKAASEPPSFPMVWEHSLLPLLAVLIPKLSSPRHIISTTRGRTPAHRRINITTPQALSLSHKLIIGKHVRDLLPSAYQNKITFVFSVGQVERMTWARGLGKELPDDICSPRNPYAFTIPAMGDSMGISGGKGFEESTATLGPCVTVDGGSYWLGNFHPFLEAYQSLGSVEVEQPSSQDRARCATEEHDAMSPDSTFKLGDLMVTSGLNLKTTRVSHEPYWEDLGKDPPLVVTDWALISSSSSRANILRRFPSETQPPVKEPLIKATSAIEPGSSVISSGRTSGYQRGLICEIPAYVSGEENGTQKATREWFIEDPADAEEAWIRGGIGVEGDSGAPVIDAQTNNLIGQIWGRNKYWGSGPRHTFFTPISDIFDDIQEKCGQEERPCLPQHRDEADRFPVYPTCRQCYDLRTYLDSRRSSRMSMQSMIMGAGDAADGDGTSIEAVSELATPRDYQCLPGIGHGVEASFNPFVVGSQGSDIKSPYAQTLDLEDHVVKGKKRTAPPYYDMTRESGTHGAKRSRIEE